MVLNAWHDSCWVQAIPSVGCGPDEAAPGGVETWASVEIGGTVAFVISGVLTLPLAKLC